MRIHHLTLLALVVGCGGDKDLDTADSADPTDTDTDTGMTTTAYLVGIQIQASALAIDTRETVTFSVDAEYSDGSVLDVTGSSALSSDNEAVLKFYAADVGQPLDGGAAVVTASYMGMYSLADISVALVEATLGDLVINEFLSDASVNGDPNGDGSFDSVEDEFIEIANISDVSVDLTGVTVWETDFPFLARHTFASGVLRAGESVVVFGGGDTSNLIGVNSWFETAVNLDPGIAYGLNLTDAGDIGTLMAADGYTTITSLAYGDQDVAGLVPATTDASTTLDPDVWGTAYTAHPTAAGAVGDYSAGVWVDGSDFEGPDGRY